MSFLFDQAVPILCGASFLVGSLVPLPYGPAIGAAAIVVVVGNVVVRKLFETTPARARSVVAGRRTAKIEGDFVVFLIGSRHNTASALALRDIGPAFTAMTGELEAADARETGFLGAENYLGLGQGSTTLSVQFWRSKEHLHAWAVSRASAHYSPWLRTMRHLREHKDCGIWHETFLVRDGEYESVYVHMPNIGLARASENVPVDKKTQTMYQRLGKEDAPDNDVPKEWREEASSY